VQKALKLTGEQKEKLQKIAQESSQKLRELLPKLREQAQAGGDRQEVMKKLAELRKEPVTKAVGVLTDDQKKTWKEMTGAPFEYQFDHGQLGNN
jgi:hypothetical protein